MRNLYPIVIIIVSLICSVSRWTYFFEIVMIVKFDYLKQSFFIDLNTTTIILNIHIFVKLYLLNLHCKFVIIIVFILRYFLNGFN